MGKILLFVLALLSGVAISQEPAEVVQEPTVATQNAGFDFEEIERSVASLANKLDSLEANTATLMETECQRVSSSLVNNLEKDLTVRLDHVDAELSTLRTRMEELSSKVDGLAQQLESTQPSESETLVARLEALENRNPFSCLKEAFAERMQWLSAKWADLRVYVEANAGPATTKAFDSFTAGCHRAGEVATMASEYATVYGGQAVQIGMTEGRRLSVLAWKESKSYFKKATKYLTLALRKTEQKLLVEHSEPIALGVVCVGCGLVAISVLVILFQILALLLRCVCACCCCRRKKPARRPKTPARRPKTPRKKRVPEGKSRRKA